MNPVNGIYGAQSKPFHFETLFIFKFNKSYRVPESQYLDSMDLLGNLFVETTDTIRCKVFLELAHLANLNVMMIGNSGCGKTTLIQDFIQDLGKLMNVLFTFHG